MDLNNLIKQFKFFFDIRGIDTEKLPNAPTGWREMLIEYSRSKTYGGLLRNITGQLDFFGKAAYLLRSEYAKYRLTSLVNLRMLEDTRKPYNTYENIYTGKIDFSKKIDKQGIFTVNAKSLDFSQNIDAYDSVQYSIPLTNAINLELPSINLNETADIIVQPNTDHRSNAFFILQIANNNQNSIDQSVYNYGGQFAQVNTPDYSTDGHFFFFARTNTNVLFTINMQGIAFYNSGSGSAVYSIQLVKSDGTVVNTLFTSAGVTTNFNLNQTFSVPILTGERLFLYFKTTDGDSNWGFRIIAATISMSYQTSTPPTMCQALTGSQLFSAMLQAMNVNTDNAPNQPVFFQSYLLANALRPLVFSCSDSIRAAQGSIYVAGNTIGPGRYKILSGSITYEAIVYTVGQQFTFNQSTTTFTGTGIVQKILSGFVGLVYNIGDSLQPGGTYEVGGDNTGNVTYNSVAYEVGETFKYVLGQDSFTGSNDTMFVKQIGLDPQIIISFADVFQAIKSIQGGDCAFGVNRYTAVNSTPSEQAKQLAGIPFIETLASVYKTGSTGSNITNLGNLSKAWQSQTALDMMYNTISVGQKDQQYDRINGYQEVSSTQYYGSALLTPVADLNLVSPVRFDPYGAESVRITQNDTAASRSDNDTWGFWINTTPIVAGGTFEYYRPLGSEGLLAGTKLAGVDPSYYNYMLSPKTNLLRGSRYLASIFYGMTGYQLRLTGYLKNVAMVYTGIDGIRIAEKDPIEIANLGTPYFIPEYYTDTLVCPDISQSEYADVEFALNGNKWNAFVVEWKNNPAMGKPQAVKLLLTAAVRNDLSRTVR